MTELVERVALSIRAAHIADLGTEHAGECDWWNWEPEARAAIAEVFAWMEKPTPAALEAGSKGRGTPTHAVLCDMWRNMLSTLRREGLGE